MLFLFVLFCFVAQFVCFVARFLCVVLCGLRVYVLCFCLCELLVTLNLTNKEVEFFDSDF